MSPATGDLILDRLTRRFTTPEGAPLVVLDDISLTVSAGETLAILGPSGSGKSTLLNIIGSLDRPDAGRVLLGDLEITALRGQALAQFRASRVGFVFQDHHLLPQLTALENVALPRLATTGPATALRKERPGIHPSAPAPPLPSPLDLLRLVGLEERAAAFPSRLSGGERQRVAIARALVNSPDLLLCDEPTGNLDRQTGNHVVSLLVQLAAQTGVTVLMVTHNAQQAARLSRCLELRDGKLRPPSAQALGGGEA